MSDSTENEEIKSVNDKVLAFGLAAVTLLVVVICGCLLVALYGMSSRYLEQSEISQNRQETIYTLQRALDNAEGKLYVYEAFINDKQERTMRKMITKYLRREKVKSTEATIEDFEKWIGIGGR